MNCRTILGAALWTVFGCTLHASETPLPMGADHSLGEFPRHADEPDDTARIQRAVDATPSGVLYVPGGVYAVSSPVAVTNLCSLNMHKSAILRAISEMPYVLKVNNNPAYRSLPKDDDRVHDCNVFMSGGCIDGNGLASCMSIDGCRHYTMRDTTFLNGKVCGLRVNGEPGTWGIFYELIADSLYFKCTKGGLAGNVAVWSTGSDSHYTDCIIVDYTTGFRMGRGGSNRLTRCHVWGGPLPPVQPGGEPEMLKDSVSFWIDGDGDVILRDCYADTAKTGFLIDGGDVHLAGCRYYNNYRAFKLDDVIVVYHRKGRLLVSECRFHKTCPQARVYKGVGTVEWRNMIYVNFPSDADLPGALEFENDQDCTSADDWELLPCSLPCVFKACPGEFAGRRKSRSERFAVSRKKLASRFPNAGAGKEMVVRARATRPDTKDVEIALIHADGKTWGTTIPLEPEWREIRVPLAVLSYFRQWPGMPPLEPGDAPDARKVQEVNICYGKWLCPDAVDKEHGFEISSVRIAGR